MEATAHLSVLLGGETTGGVGDDVVGLAPVGSLVAVLVGALAVAQLDAPPGGPGEQPGGGTDLDPVGRSEHRPFDQGLVEPGHERTRGDHRPLGQLEDPSLHRLVADQDTEQGNRSSPVGGSGL